ncbi:MAG: carboxypeptidase regulatory-like domain-containing protein, partial [Clostridiales bacterium]|nr:carboxypeptidase regulatory-like domain-containing protein [Clostridiales bacterium]
MNIKPGRLGVRRLLCLSIAMLMMVAAMSVDGMVVTGAEGSGDVVAAGDGGTGADALENDADLPSAAGFEELAVYDNSIGGTLWVDENADGVRDGDEQPLAGFVVRLYAEDDLTERVQAVPADENGQYRFENIEPGRYVVGIAAGYAGADKYEPAAADITGDNKFALADNGENAYTEVIEVKEDSIITGLAAGLREIAGIMPTGTTLGYTVTGDGSINNVSYNTLQEAMADITSDNGTTYTITVSQDDPSMGAQVPIPAGKDSTLASSGGPRTITTAETQSAVTTFYGVRHFHINGGSLTLDNIILAGEFGYTSGTIANGGVSVVNSTDGSSGSLTMKNGSKITKCYNGQYGGGVAVSSSTFIMEDSEVSVNGCYQYGGGIFALLSTVTLGNNCVIDKNTALQNGGGMFLRQSTITMENDIKITNNKVTVATSTGQGVAGGGGIHLYQTDLHFTGGEISDNSSVLYGGGVSLNSNSNFTMSGGLITNNTAVDNGGGLYFNSGGTFEMNGGTISYNKAGNGGGVGFGNSSTL